MHIHAQHISLQIGKKTLLYALTADFEPNKFHLILGANGAGKSTLVKILSGQIRPSEGDVIYGDKRLQDYKVQELAKFRAVLSQSVDFAFPLTVQEVVMMGCYPHFSTQPKTSDQEIVKQAMNTFGISDFNQRDYTSLSGGEKQRVHFARIMAQIWPEDSTPKILFLDEPLTYLDVKFQHEFLQKVKDFIATQNLTLIGVLHDLNLAARFADTLFLLKEGSLVACGSKEEVLTSENIKNVYGMTPHFIREGERFIIDF